MSMSPSDQLPVGLIAKLEEGCTGIDEVMGSMFSSLIFAYVAFVTAMINQVPLYLRVLLTNTKDDEVSFQQIINVYV